ncbi:PD-(D/E)XK nuclease family protein [Aestuariibaculum sp. M13]|uniref:PD-(D/E)XK nuclease family protein n=1 Tax=Aestuariibaculum sp. M13 TaxID=2967132 RepID=UPI00215A09C3|nr:PD-(D/E)XK nuclease family protein [Aestuariibaculum sp. M13]MCR8666226.1 PD-(D/E)XK nuclease family protein [Aestuariibaculum sp. M13]
MFISLYKLYNSTNSNRTPLEDFTTECFAGVLQCNADVLVNFIKFLKLKPGNYEVLTQVKYTLPDDPNCIVDMVLESDTTVCFIENKVNSKEGWEQLARYAKVLDGIDKETHLRYCTKHVDTKKEKQHHFKQFRWYDIGNLLEKHHDKNVMAMQYLHFLKQQQMAIDTSISTDTVITLKHFLNSYDAMDFHVKNVEPDFKKLFSDVRIVKQEKLSKIREHDRIARMICNPLQDTSYHTEILYAIHFESCQLQTQLWVHKSHPQCAEIQKRGKDSGLFNSSEINEYGLHLKNTKKLFHFIDSKNSDVDIKQWFLESFQKVKQFIDDNQDLNWNENVTA